jgi:hypothetical protein
MSNGVALGEVNKRANEQLTNSEVDDVVDLGVGR